MSGSVNNNLITRKGGIEMQVAKTDCSSCGSSARVQSSPAGRAEGVGQPELKLGTQASPLENRPAAFAVTDGFEFSLKSLEQLDLTAAGASAKELDEASVQQLQELKRRDAEVRSHEQAHLSAAGGFAKGGATFSYEKGADGRLYAVGGEVSIDASEIPDDPEATLQKARTVMRAALAPADPSAADRTVAAKAATMAAEAQQEITHDGGRSLPGLDDGLPPILLDGEGGGRMSVKEVDE
jgi:hypothetical protein